MGFSRLGRASRQSMPEMMADASRCIRGILPGVMPWEIDVFRGDGWQALLTEPAYALRAAAVIRAYIRALGPDPRLDTRMAIGVGPVDYVPEGRVAAGDGPAFRSSGKMLEKMAAPSAGVLRYACPGAPFESLADALVRAVGALMETWRPLRARAVLGLLCGLKRAQVAARWPTPISRQAVSKHLKNARWDAVAHAIAVFEETHKTTLYGL